VSDRYIARSAAIAARLLEGEMVIMSALDSTLFTLNPTATAIWQAADGVTPLQEIVRQAIQAQFSEVPESALQDAEAFVEALARHGILLLSDRPITEASALGATS